MKQTDLETYFECNESASGTRSPFDSRHRCVTGRFLSHVYIECEFAYETSCAVGIINAHMKTKPDLKRLTWFGAAVLKLLAGQDDVSRALPVLLNFGKYDDMITQALGLLGNLALIEENARFIVACGGLDCLMSLIKYKCKKKK
eukprot:897004_1